MGQPPQPDVAQYVLDGLERQSPEDLRAIASYCQELADAKEAEAQRQLDEAAAEVDRDTESPDDLPEGVPGKATLTIKEINDNRYYYYQWRDGDSIKSQYKSPVGDK